MFPETASFRESVITVITVEFRPFMDIFYEFPEIVPLRCSNHNMGAFVGVFDCLFKLRENLKRTEIKQSDHTIEDRGD